MTFFFFKGEELGTEARCLSYQPRADKERPDFRIREEAAAVSSVLGRWPCTSPLLEQSCPRTQGLKRGQRVGKQRLGSHLD